MARSRKLVVTVLLLALAVAGCGRSSLSPSGDVGAGTAGELSVVATTTIMGDLVQRVVGEEGTVEVLMPVGADPHGFAPSAAQVTRVRDADLVVANGLGLEEGLVAVLEAAEEEGVVVFEATDHVALLEGGDDHADEGEEHADEEEDHADGDPHVWFDPMLMADVVRSLGDTLAGVDDAGDVDWSARAEQVATDLMTLDAEIEEVLAAIPEDRRLLVTNHDVLAYFAQRYDFTVASVIIPGGSTLAEPSASSLDDVIVTVSDAGVPAIFAETTNPSRLAEVVAEEVGGAVTVVELFTESLSDADGDAPTYEAMMRTNASRILEGLTG